jgi:hypothetical protein
MKNILFLILLLATDTWLCAAPSQTTWYVSGEGAVVTGNDRNPGTKKQPLASVQRA